MGLAGVREGGDLFWSERPVPVNPDQHAIDRYLGLTDSVGCQRREWKGRIPVFEADKNKIRAFLRDQIHYRAPLVAINPMAKWDTKLWDPVLFAQLADRLIRELSCQVVFTGSGGDEAEITRIAHLMESNPMNLTGQTTLKELAYLYSKCDAVVSTDTGPMHIAAASECPVIALFGPTAPGRTGPYGAGHQVIRSDIHCSPCFEKKCDHASCMGDIAVDSVLTAVEKVLN
jgi:lipopolysaccharide heptosyltransferase II